MRRERALLGLCLFWVQSFGGAQRFGNAEVQQLHLARFGDEHVAGLQVAVHQELAMGVRHGVCELQEQLQPRFKRQARAGLVDGQAMHTLHHKIGCAKGRAASVQQVGNVRVCEPRQGLLL